MERRGVGLEEDRRVRRVHQRPLRSRRRRYTPLVPRRELDMAVIGPIVGRRRRRARLD